ncbi:MAG: allophanate hydrolase subunit 1 [Thermoanaerobaculia bacterium]
MSPRPTLLALGETAVRIDFAGGLDRTTIARVRGAARALAEERAARSEALRAVLDLVAVGPSLLVRLDPRSVTEELEREILAICERACSGVEAEPEPRRIEVPITYDGPDLEQVARRSGLDSDEVVRRHLAGDYFVAAVGFAPGFAYLGGLDPRLHLARRASPRSRVPAGAVAIGGPYSAVYPGDTPGGWHWIGSTPLRPFAVDRLPATPFAAGDRVEFRRQS